MPEGVIVGGWNFVIAAYAVTGLVVVAYSIHLLRTHFSGGRRDHASR